MYRFCGKISISNKSIQLRFQMKAYCWMGFDQICSFNKYSNPTTGRVVAFGVRSGRLRLQNF
jgi:hypothetical protein